MTSPTDLHGKVRLVTGANSGIGQATALGLAKMGATVVISSRSAERGQAARDEIVKASGNESVELLIADLASQVAVRRLADEFKAKADELDHTAFFPGLYPPDIAANETRSDDR